MVNNIGQTLTDEDSIKDVIKIGNAIIDICDSFIQEWNTAILTKENKGENNEEGKEVYDGGPS